MPTDPFVASELHDAPRHRQNLPAGIAYPPSRKARTARPGELGPRQPDGPLLGSPGPNVGYARTLAERTKPILTLAAHEPIDDATSVIAETAMKRAASFGRAPTKADLDVAVAVFAYDGTASPEFAAWRAQAVHHADHDYATRRAVVDLVDEQLLRTAPSEIGTVAASWRRAVIAGDPPAPPHETTG